MNANCDLKICDFGLATIKEGKINKDYELTNYVVTRWFRAPEILLKYGCKNYSTKLDMWSVGCVFAEMYLKKVLFGASTHSKQMKRIVRLLGMPSENIMDKIKDEKVK